MAVTDCSVGTSVFTPQSAKEHMGREAGSPICQLRAIAGLCSASKFEPETISKALEDRRISGDATDQAALRFAESLDSVETLRKAWNSVFELAFDSKNKFMVKAFTLADSSGLEMVLPPDEVVDFQTKNSM